MSPRKRRAFSPKVTGVKLSEAARIRLEAIAVEKGVTVSECLRTMIASILTAPGDSASALIECQKGYRQAVERLEAMERALLFSTDLGVLAEAERAGWSWEALFRNLAKLEVALADPAKVEDVLGRLNVKLRPEGPLNRWLYVFVRELRGQMPERDMSALFGLPPSSFAGKDPKAIVEMLQAAEK
jgi:hypothetical protein